MVTWVACDLADRLAAEHAIHPRIRLAAVSDEAYARPEPLARGAASASGALAPAP